MVIIRRLPFLLICYFCFIQLSYAFPLDQWFVKQKKSPQGIPLKFKNNTINCDLSFPGEACIYAEYDNNTQVTKNDFLKLHLSMEILIKNKKMKTLTGTFFIKEKNHLWYQKSNLVLKNTKWKKIRIDLTPTSSDLSPVGHGLCWNGLSKVRINSIGFKFQSKEKMICSVKIRNIRLDEEYIPDSVMIYNWSLPKEGHLNKLINSAFSISREYYNPFDPDEICINVEIISPDNKKTVIPAFYAVDYIRKLNIGKEVLIPINKPYWAFRFTPYMTGKYKIRLILLDNTKDEAEKYITAYKQINIISSSEKGYVRINKKYLELSTGKFFFPVGFNLHTIRDQRSERIFKFNLKSDMGTYSYDQYFYKMCKSNINATEIWMSPWGVGIEWSKSRSKFEGLGRYNLENAWKLDYLLQKAIEKNIYINLVVENHGKLSKSIDEEWSENPYNKNQLNAFADGGMLDHPHEFFSSKKALNYYLKKIRYIAARWGAFNNIMSVEILNEADLMDNFKKVYHDGEAIKWIQTVHRAFQSQVPRKHLMACHFAKSYKQVLEFEDIAKIQDVDIILCDAYRRKPKNNFVNHIKEHCQKLSIFNKAVMITEFGGSGMGASPERIIGDLHAGLWSSIFYKQAGAPFLWWHEFVDTYDCYKHYSGFSRFIKGIDLRNKNFSETEKKVYLDNSEDLKHNCLWMNSGDEAYGWIYNKEMMYKYPSDNGNLPLVERRQIQLRSETLNPGKYKLTYYNTMTGQIIKDEQVLLNGMQILKIPPFKIDTALKLLKQ